MAEQEQKPKYANAVETEWIRGYARTYFPSEAPFRYRPAMLRRSGITLVDVRNVLRSGVVTFSDKLDQPGAIWVVEGDDAGERRVRVTLRVVSNEMSVTLQDVELLGGTRTGIEKGGGDDAA